MNEATTDEPARTYGPVESEEKRNERWKQMGARIKEARGELSQQALAEALSSAVPDTRTRTRAAIAQYESGANPPSFQTVYDLAHVLGVSADFLMTGELPSEMMEGAKRVNWAKRAKKAEMFSLPSTLITEFGIGDMDLEFVRLAVDAGALGANVGDYALVDKGGSEIIPDGQLYVLDSLAGPTLARAEAIPTGDGMLMLTTGKNATIAASPGSMIALGRVVSVIKRSL